LTLITDKAGVTVSSDVTAGDTDEVDWVAILSLVTILSGHTSLLGTYSANFVADEVARTLIGATALTTPEVFSIAVKGRAVHVERATVGVELAGI